MVPAQNVSKLHQHHQNNLLLLQNIDSSTSTYYGNYGKYTAAECFGLMMSRAAEGYENCSTTESCLGSDLVVGNPMAEDESRTNSLNEAAGSSSKDAQEEIKDQDQDHGWLQLSIGGHTAGGHSHIDNKNHHHPHHHDHDRHHHDQILEPTARRGSGLMIELDLLPGGGSSSSSRQAAAAAVAARSSTGPTFQAVHEIGIRGAPVTNFGSATNNFSTTSLMYFQHPGHHGSTSTSSNFPPHNHQQELNWGAFRPNLIHPSQNINLMPSSTSLSPCSSSLMPQLGSSYFGRQFQLQPPSVEAPAGPSIDFRVVNPPRRPQSGIWFTLQASQNQAKEPFLPQISKSFLRIRDGRMTVRLIIKYLVNKLRLESESEIEITCRGQQLLPSLTLQDVRDNIWGPTVTLLPDSSTTDHVMVLHYARSA